MCLCICMCIWGFLDSLTTEYSSFLNQVHSTWKDFPDLLLICCLCIILKNHWPAPKSVEVHQELSLAISKCWIRPLRQKDSSLPLTLLSLGIVWEERWNNHRPFWKFKHKMTQGFIPLLNNSLENKILYSYNKMM